MLLLNYRFLTGLIVLLLLAMGCGSGEKSEEVVRVSPGEKIGVEFSQTPSNGGVMLGFTDKNGATIYVRGEPNRYSPSVIGAPAPIFFDFESEASDKGHEVSLSLFKFDDNNVVASEISYLPEAVIIEKLPELETVPGEITLAFLSKMHSLYEELIDRYDFINDKLGGRDYSTLVIVNQLKRAKSSNGWMRYYIEQLMEGKVEQYALGKFDGVDAVLNIESIALMDKILVSYIANSFETNHRHATIPRIFSAGDENSADNASKKLSRSPRDLDSIISNFGVSLLHGSANIVREKAKEYRDYAGILVGVTAVVVGAPAVTAAAVGAVAYSALTFVPAAISLTLHSGQTYLNELDTSINSLEESFDTVVDGSVAQIAATLERKTTEMTGKVSEAMLDVLEVTKAINSALDNTEYVRSLVTSAKTFCNTCAGRYTGEITATAPPGTDTPLYTPPVLEDRPDPLYQVPTIQPYVGEVVEGGCNIDVVSCRNSDTACVCPVF